MKRHLLGFLSWAAVLGTLPILLLGAVRPTLSAPGYAPVANPQNPCATALVSVNSSGVEGNGDSEYASISHDGRYVAFDSVATNLVPGGTNSFSQVFVRDRWACTYLPLVVK